MVVLRFGADAGAPKRLRWCASMRVGADICLRDDGRSTSRPLSIRMAGMRHSAISRIPTFALFCAVVLAASSVCADDVLNEALPWSFRPLERPEAPPCQSPNADSWISTPVDNFVLARLEAAGLEPSPEADRRTLIRRASYDLLGLPPTYDEVEEFVRDDRPDAWARLVERLLASPAYGERWGRHWLDVARYADTKDLVLVYGKDSIRPYAYTYRDYIVRAMNEDIPYDELILDQLAADQRFAEGDDESWRLAGMGLLTLARIYDFNMHDVHDDQIDTVTRGFLGLTVSCARCHDHKYDPVSMEDYYALYGIFASSIRPLEDPRISTVAGASDAARQCEEKIQAKTKELRDHIDSQYDSITKAVRGQVTNYLVHVATTKPDPLENVVFFLSLSPDQLHPQTIAAWRRLIASRASPDDPIFGAWHALLGVPEAELASRSREIIAGFLARERGTRPGEIHRRIAERLEASPPTSRADVGRIWGELLRDVDQVAGTAGDVSSVDRPILDLVRGPGSPLWFPKSETYLHMSRVPRDRYHGLQLEVDKIAVHAPDFVPRAMVVVDAEEIVEPRVFVRGNPTQPGKHVARRFLSALGGSDDKPFTQGSGRLELARAIADPENPLTARVIVNRVWQHHFGAPLVSTPSDFGRRSAPPSHPELLDWLATELIRSGWSLKALHRQILLSSTWRQSSLDRAECRRVDPENRLLWRAHRRRLELEPYRDTFLAVSGRLDPTVGGRPVDAAEDPECRRRTIYGLVDRKDVPPLYRAFDFPSPEQSTGERPLTTVPQAALFNLNSPFIATQVRSLMMRPVIASAADGEDRVRALYRVVFAREPSDEEVELALAFISAESSLEATEAAPEGGLSTWERYAQTLLMTSELQYVD